MCNVAFGQEPKGDAEHIVRWDPARVLAECAAKRGIVERYRHKAESMARYPIQGNAARLMALDEVLRLLALPFREHPDFDLTWTRDAAPGDA